MLAAVMKFIFLAAKTKNPKEKRGVGIGVQAETPLKWRYLFPPFLLLCQKSGLKRDNRMSKKAGLLHSFHKGQ